METIFDHNPTEEELKLIGISEKNAEEYLNSEFPPNADIINENISSLYLLRNNEKKAIEYENKIKNFELRQQAGQLREGDDF